MLIVPYRQLSSLSPLCTCSTCLNITPTCPYSWIYFLLSVWQFMSSTEEWDCTQPDPLAALKAGGVTLGLGYCVSCETLVCSFFLLKEGRKKILIKTQFICSVLLDSLTIFKVIFSMFFTQTVLQCGYKEPSFLAYWLSGPASDTRFYKKKNSFDFRESVIFWQVT